MIFRLSKFQSCVIAALALFSSSNIMAQEAPYGSLGLRRIYQSTLINPTLVPDSTSVENSLSFIPFLPASPFDFGGKVDMGAFDLGTLNSSIQNGTLNLNLLVNGMSNSKNANTFVGMNVSLLHVYLNVGKKGSKLEISQRLKATASTNMINKEFFGVFINDDNQTNRAVNLTDSKMQAMAWNEIAVGYTTAINSKWTVGVKAKYLTGVAYADFTSKNLTGTLGPNGNSFNIDSQVRTSSLNPISDRAYNQDLTPYQNNLSSMLLNCLGKNTGLAMDAGVKYNVSKAVKVFAGFNDLGFITWKNNPLIYHNSAVLTDFYPVKEDQSNGSYTLNLDDFTKSGNVTPTKFTTMLNTHLNSGATWQPNKTFHSTLLMDAYVVNGAIMYPGATVAGTLNGGKFSEISANVGYNVDRPFRVGLGGSMKAGVLQMHLFSNNVVGLINPNYLRSVDVQFGLSWVWRNKTKKTV